jgi:hypothetical protein
MPQGVTAREHVGRTALPNKRCAPDQDSRGNRSDARERPTSSNSKGKRKWEADRDDRETRQASGSLDLKTMIEQCLEETRQKRRRARLEEEFLEVDGSEEDGASVLEEKGSEEGGSEQESVSGAEEPQLEQTTPKKSSEHGEISQDDQHNPSVAEVYNQNDPMSISNQGMSRQEKKWWSMNFEDLYKYATSNGFGKTGKEGRKSGRVKIIKWLCEKKDITPYVTPIISSVEATPIIARPMVQPNGAISHPEAILRTSDPDVQLLINTKAQEYEQKPAVDLLKLAMGRSYQLLKDSNGKLPSKSITALSQWLAAWDILKSPREKKWWLGDGIDLVNKAKAMGYQGPSKKYEVIVWLRSTPEDAEIEIAEVAEPTPNKKDEAELKISKRYAKGSRRAERC